MKPATVPQSGQVIETTTRQRVLPDSSLPIDSKTPSLWEYLADVEKKREWDKHTIYLHRMEPGNPDGSGMIVWKGAQYLTLPDGTQVPLWDREEVEFALLKHYGGKRFRLMVKRGAQLVTRGEIFIDAAPRMIVPPANSPNSGMNVATSSADGSVAGIANKAIDTIAGQEHAAVNLGLNMMATSANVIKAFAEGRPAASSPSDQMMQQFMAAMLTRLTVDPMQQMLQFLTVIKELNGVVGGGGGAAGMPPGMLEKLFSAMFEKFMNPTPSGPPISAVAEAVRQAPQIISGLAETVREQRLMREAELRLLQSGRPLQPMPNPQVIAPAAPNPPPQPAPSGQPHTGAPTMEFVETKIMEIFKQPISAQQAADEAMAFLDTLDPNAITQLAALGEEGMLRLFASRPILAHATANPTRLTEFIRAFLKMHAEDQAAENAQPAAKPPLPN